MALNFTPELDNYILEHSGPEDELLAEISSFTHAEVLYPNMLSGPIQGGLLEMFSRMIRPKQILEIGTYTGYSALCLVRGLEPGGHLHTIEQNDELKGIIESFFDRSQQKEQITLHTGNALTIIPALKESFDLVFIDGEKEEYPDYFNLVIDKTTVGGYILADNVLWGGKVIDRGGDKSTRGIQEFNRMVQHDQRVQNVLLPVRDGIMMIRKVM